MELAWLFGVMFGFIGGFGVSQEMSKPDPSPHPQIVLMAEDHSKR